MATLEALRERLPEAARDLKLNLETVLRPGGALNDAQRWGVAVASAIAARQPELRDAVLAEAIAHVPGEVPREVIDDAQAAAALMAMNNVYYRFRHIVGKPSYEDMPARLRMNRLGKPAGAKVDFELFCLAVSAINNCQKCVVAHERTILEAGLTEEHVHEAVRLAAVINGVAMGLELGVVP